MTDEELWKYAERRHGDGLWLGRDSRGIVQIRKFGDIVELIAPGGVLGEPYRLEEIPNPTWGMGYVD